MSGAAARTGRQKEKKRKKYCKKEGTMGIQESMQANKLYSRRKNELYRGVVGYSRYGISYIRILLFKKQNTVRAFDKKVE